MPNSPMREQVLAAFFNALGSITGIDGLVVARNRDSDVTTFPTLVMVDGGHKVDVSNSAFTRYDMQVSVEGYVVAETSADLGGVMNTLYAAVIAAVMQDYTLGGLCFDIEEQDAEAMIDRSEGVQPNCAFSTSFLITFFTKVGDPYSPAP